jgi:hypothetical protein
MMFKRNMGVEFVIVIVLAFIALMVATGAWSASAPPSFSVQDATCSESAGACTITINKSGPARAYSVIRVYTWTSNSTATSGVDFQPINVNVTFGNNVLTKTVIVPIINDTAVEGPETFKVDIGGVRFAAIARAEATVTIIDDDIAPPPPPPPPPPPVPAVTWTKCADEGGVCNIGAGNNGMVHYGVAGNWVTRLFTESIACSVQTFGDPAPGLAKYCETNVAPIQPAPPPPPAPSPTPTPAPSTRDPTYGDQVTALQACTGGYIKDQIIVGQTYKVVGLAATMPVPVVGGNYKPDIVILNPVPDDGVHRGDGWFGLWIDMACVSRPSVMAAAHRVLGEQVVLPALKFTAGASMVATKHCFEADDTQGHGRYMTEPGKSYQVLPNKAKSDRLWVKFPDDQAHTGVYLKACFSKLPLPGIRKH